LSLILLLVWRLEFLKPLYYCLALPCDRGMFSSVGLMPGWQVVNSKQAVAVAVWSQEVASLYAFMQCINMYKKYPPLCRHKKYRPGHTHLCEVYVIT
jgi:hypothetical protein